MSKVLDFRKPAPMPDIPKLQPITEHPRKLTGFLQTALEASVAQLDECQERRLAVEARKREEREKRQAQIDEARELLNSDDTVEFLRGVDTIIELEGIDAGLHALRLRIIKGA